jgi:hypothetical protein
MLMLALVACDSRHIEELERGVSTEADVRKRFGEPAAVYTLADGSRTLEYPRQPEGQRNYMITIGPDGKMTSLRQVLKPETFAEVTPGLHKSQGHANLSAQGRGSLGLALPRCRSEQTLLCHLRW